MLYNDDDLYLQQEVKQRTLVVIQGQCNLLKKTKL